MPGVEITTGAVAGPSTVSRAPSGAWFVTGLTERGPANVAVKITSLAEFIRVFGSRPSYGSLYDAVECFFQESGSVAHVVRVVGGAATQGALAAPLVDRAGTPVPTMQFTARGPGAWSSAVTVEILDGSVENTFTVRIRYAGNIVSTYVNLTSPQDAVARMMNDAWITVTDLGSATVAPGNNPAVKAPTALTAGTDDRAAVVSSTYVTALGKFGPSLGDGAVSIPGGGDGVHAGLIAHANAYNRIAILATSRNTAKADLLDLAASIDSPRAGLFAPWVRVDNGVGGVRAIGPEGYIAGARARLHERVGPWGAAAGDAARASWVRSVDQEFSDLDAKELDAGRVNAIVGYLGGVRNYGWRSLAVDEVNWSMLSGADTLNRVVVMLSAIAQSFVFRTIDAGGQLLGAIEGAFEGALRPLMDAGGLFPRYQDGTMLDPGYRIVVNESNNTTATLATDTVFADVQIRVSPTAATVRLSVSKAAVTAQL